MRKGAVLLAGLAAALLFGAGSAGTAPPTPKGPVFWNTLGSAYAVRHSVVGPNLAMFNCRDRRMPHFGPRCSIDIRGRLAFVRGPNGEPAATIGGGPYFSEARIHTALLRRSVLNPEHGTIDAWYRQTSDPEPYVHNPHRIFGGPYSMARSDVELFVQKQIYSPDARLDFGVSFRRGDAGLVFADSLADGGVGYPISALNGTWIHVAAVWDRQGIDGTSDTVRLYVNGKLVAASRESDWGTSWCRSARTHLGCFIDVVGCNDTCARKFAVADLRIWDYAKTDFSSARR